MSFLTCSRPDPSSKMGSSAVAVSSSVCIFPACHSFLPLEPGTGSSHPGNVRRQGPPRRSSELGHPIRRKSVSSFTMAGPEANKHHLLRMSVTLLPSSPPCSPPAEPLRASPPPAPSCSSPLKRAPSAPKSKPVALRVEPPPLPPPRS